MKRLTVPNRLIPQNITHFLRNFSILFTNKPSQDEVVYIVNKGTELSILGACVLYKAINHAALNRSYRRWHVDCDSNFRSQLMMYGLGAWIDDARRGLDSVIIQFPSRLLTMGSWIVTPQSLHRRSMDRDSFKNNITEALKYYYSNSELTEMICSCLCEILSNFWEHAISDPTSILITEYSKDVIRIACTDTGDGIVRTLRKSNSEYNSYKPHLVILDAIKPLVTSKPSSNHMGLGLWLLDRMATKSGGGLHIYSQGGYYMNEAGKTYSGECGYWDGTIVYLDLPLGKIISVHEILAERDDLTQQDIKVNFV